MGLGLGLALSLHVSREKAMVSEGDSGENCLYSFFHVTLWCEGVYLSSCSNAFFQRNETRHYTAAIEEDIDTS